MPKKLLLFLAWFSCGLLHAQGPITCPEPTNLTLVANASGHSVSWTAGGTETSWNLEYGPVGFLPGSGTSIPNLTVPTTTIVGLIIDSYYEVHVQANCVSEVSTWLDESFFVGYCKPNSDDGLTYIDKVSTSGAFANISNLNSGYATDGYGEYTAQFIKTFADASFYLTVRNSEAIGTSVWIDWNNNLTFETTEIFFSTAMATLDFTTQIAVPAGALPGNYRMRILADLDDASPANPCALANSKGETEDYFITVLPTPTCLTPTNLAISATSVSSLNLTWTATGTATSWIVEYGVEGFTLGAGTILNTTTPSLLINNLQGFTTYDIYVKADCGNGDISYEAAITGTTNLVCGAIFTDNGGITGDYSSNQNQSWTICAGNAQTVMVEFTGLDLENGYDYLKVYKGFTLFETYTGNQLPDVIYSDAGACLKFVFTSDGGGEAAGWVANITCKNCVPVPGVDAHQSVCASASEIDLNSVIQTSESGVWKMNVMSTTVSEAGLFDFEYLTPGLYKPYFVMGVANVPGCITDTIFANITIDAISNSGIAEDFSTCNFGSVYLFNGLSGAYHGGGIWTDASNQSIVGGVVSFDDEMLGSHAYTYTVTNGVCAAKSTTIAIDVTQCASVESIIGTQFSMYPNPTSDDVYIQFDGVSSLVELLVLDVKGAIIARETVVFEQNSAHKVDLRNVESGIYFIQLNTDSQNSSWKVIKN